MMCEKKISIRMCLFHHHPHWISITIFSTWNIFWTP